MSKIVGIYQHEKSENLDEYFKTLNLPYLARKMIYISNPRKEIRKEGDKWIIKNITMMRTQVWEFFLDTEWEEVMPSGVKLKNTTTIEGDSLIIVSINEDGNKVTRRHDFDDNGVVLTLSHERTDLVAKRYFKRVS
ncbi:sodium/calcium exchanger regulatory protein 1-like isoform X1 [Microplitis mediator]|uniref:sodium/calcium exchanger regulatory protein 1-like isoform X1 n=1 Tax=Microplitis mediator TaxID=375433 RepID=UPI002554217B|nr:sodium/calcium exchanger regulatory protein 1-like isoform X1 [Microplitis mediator]XP_057336083.1 sodium/calcium exchanger regulatory protein 1-like isoform X1 [Microplitis mediator]